MLLMISLRYCTSDCAAFGPPAPFLELYSFSSSGFFALTASKPAVLMKSPRLSMRRALGLFLR